MSVADGGGTEWGAGELRDKLERGEDFFVFDVRNEDEYDAWKIEGTKPLPMVNVPYYEMLEFDDHDDVVDSFKEFLEKSWSEKLPRNKDILVVCAKGDTSEYVAEAMRQMEYQAFNLEGGTIAWGDHYHSRPVVETESLSLFQISRPARGCLSYLVESDGKAVLIDPLRHAEKYREILAARGLELALVLDTHGHADHISGGPDLARESGAEYWLHPYDGIHPIDVMPAKITYDFLTDGREFTVGGATIRTIHIPGHTLGNVAFLLNERYLFTGDSIFIESIARPDLGGRGDVWAPLHYHSLRMLLDLPDETVVLPAHFSTLKEEDGEGLVARTLGELKRENEGLVMVQKSEQEFVDYILSSLPKFPEEYVDIKRVNAGLLEVSEGKASELELGKNICALSQAYEDEG